MKVCPITYEELKGKAIYSKEGLRSLSPLLSHLRKFPYTADDQRREAEVHSSRLSIQGVQPKLSAALSIQNEVFKIVDHGGRYILKPQVERYPHLPENEDLTMRLAAVSGIEIPLHGLLQCKDGSLTYFIRRFDRAGQRQKLHVEDFAQLSGESRDTKYSSSMEKVAKVIDRFCTFPAVEKVKLFRQTVFSFLVGNEDMHLKNFSLIVRDQKVQLSPAYDLINSTLVIAHPREELALPIRGKRNKLGKEDFIKYFALSCLDVSNGAVSSVMNDFEEALPKWEKLIQRSFLPTAQRKKYLEIIHRRAKRLGLF